MATRVSRKETAEAKAEKKVYTLNGITTEDVPDEPKDCVKYGEFARKFHGIVDHTKTQGINLTFSKFTYTMWQYYSQDAKGAARKDGWLSLGIEEPRAKVDGKVDYCNELVQVILKAEGWGVRYIKGAIMAYPPEVLAKMNSGRAMANLAQMGL